MKFGGIVPQVGLNTHRSTESDF